jgi:hypothetical protein
MSNRVLACLARIVELLDNKLAGMALSVAPTA